jgi:hypothetical protein
MVSSLLAIFSLFVAASGWHYLFQARGPYATVEDPTYRYNIRRLHFRKLGGLLMLVLGSLIFAGFFAVDQSEPTSAFIAIWLSVMTLVLIVILLALVDLRLTLKMRQIQRQWHV